jgi:hypothetical protein
MLCSQTESGPQQAAEQLGLAGDRLLFGFRRIGAGFVSLGGLAQPVPGAGRFKSVSQRAQIGRLRSPTRDVVRRVRHDPTRLHPGGLSSQTQG